MHEILQHVENGMIASLKRQLYEVLKVIVCDEIHIKDVITKFAA